MCQNRLLFLWDRCPEKQLLGSKDHVCLTFNPWVKIPWGREWQPTPVFLPGEPLWTEEPGRLQSMGSKESDMTEQLTLSLSCLTLLEVSKLFFSEWLTILHSIQQGMRYPVCMLNSICYFHYLKKILATPQGMWDLSSPTRDQTHAPGIERQSLNH